MLTFSAGIGESQEKVEVISRGLYEVEGMDVMGGTRFKSNVDGIRRESFFIPLIAPRPEPEGNNQSDRLPGKAWSRIFEFLSGNKYHSNFGLPEVGHSRDLSQRRKLWKKAKVKHGLLDSSPSLPPPIEHQHQPSHFLPWMTCLSTDYEYIRLCKKLRN